MIAHTGFFVKTGICEPFEGNIAIPYDRCFHRSHWLLQTESVCHFYHGFCRYLMNAVHK